MVKIKRFFLSFYSGVIKGILNIFYLIEKNRCYTVDVICNIINSKSKKFIFYGLYEKHPTFNLKKCSVGKDYSDFAIVIQGLIKKEDDYTLESARLYKRLYPECKIIVSTWDSEPKDYLALFRAEGFEVVINKTFTPCGFGNINYQLCTSLAGLNLAKKLGVSYVIKSRTDQRFNKKFTLEFLRSLIDLFPISASNILGLRSRIIALSGPMYLPLYFTDFFYFGYIDDMISLFNIPYDMRQIPKSQLYYKEHYGDAFPAVKFYDGQSIPPEVYIISRFLQKNEKVDYTVKYYWEVIKKYFITISGEDIDLHWSKYGNKSVVSARGLEDQDTWNSLSSFISLYSGILKYDISMENIVNEVIIKI